MTVAQGQAVSLLRMVRTWLVQTGAADRELGPYNGDEGSAGVLHEIELLLADPSAQDLRDYFAGQAISQCHITVDTAEAAPDPEVIRAYAARFARTAYIIADAMMAARGA